MSIQPGDVLLYNGKGLFSWLIKLKTGQLYSHCEVYIGAGKALASRDGIGVGEYLVRTKDLEAILRPVSPPNLIAGYKWFLEEANGQKYDWFGLFNFWWAKWKGQNNNRMFCSEFVVRFFRSAELPLFPRTVDADGVNPGELELSTQLVKIPVEVRHE